MNRDLTSELCFDGVDFDELREVFQTHYKTSRGVSDRASVQYPGVDDYCLSIHTNKKGKTSILSGPAFSIDDFKKLKEEILEKLINSPGTEVWAWILFSNIPLRGRFCRADFQMYPVPETAPRQNSVFPAPEPFVLEHVIKLSSDRKITGYRAERRRTELARLLNTFLNVNITEPEYRYIWGIDMTKPRVGLALPTQEQLSYIQEYYTFDGFKRSRTNFENSTVPIVPQISPTDYYNPYSVNTEVDHSQLCIPNNMTLLFDAFEALTPEDKRDFLRAVSWIYVADNNNLYKQSSSFISLVTSIEVLVKKPKKEICRECLFDRSPGPTRLFREFLKEHARGVDKKIVEELYEVRSNLVHGSLLFEQDQRRFGITSESMKQRNWYRQLRYVTQIAILNWLIDSSLKNNKK